jgi:hypothetical protein
VWLLSGGAILGWIPIVAWNVEHDWASFRHVFWQIGGEQSVGGEFQWYGPFIFLAGQFGILFGGWLAAFLVAAWRFRHQRTPTQDEGLRLIWWCSVPVWCIFALASFIKAGQPNWPAPAYLGGIILAFAWLRDEVSGQYARSIRLVLSVTVSISLFAVAVIHFPGIIRPLLAQLVKKPSEAKPLPVRNLDITARLVGWKTLAKEVDRARARLVSTTGEEPILGGTYWTIPGHLGFYCEGHPQAYALGIPNKSDRHSQYDFWRPNPVKDAQAFLGRTFVIVGDIGPGVRNGFERIEPAIQVAHSEDGIPIAAWTIWICHGFRGFADTDGRIPGY